MLESLRTGSRRLRKCLQRYFVKEIWRQELVGGHTWRARGYAVLRVVAITTNGIRDNHLLNRAAAMSFYSLIAMGPLVAVIVMVSGFVLRGQNEAFAADAIKGVVEFMAPPVAEFGRLEQPNGSEDPEAEPVVNTELVDLLNTIIESAQTAGGGLVGALILVFIALQLLTITEKTYNEIWGVRRGRSWGERIVFYWTFLSLGAVLGFGSVGLLTTTTIANIFDVIPFGTLFLENVLHGFAPLLGFLLIATLLASFYVFFPNTAVQWKAAWIGAAFVAVLLVLNNYFSVVYVHRVVTNRSLYGSVGIIPVLMIGLYVFWFFLLLGGQLTYAVQNANLLTRRHAWNNISIHSREILALAVFLIIARRFHNCEPAPSATEISAAVRAPGNILNESLRNLQETGWVAVVKDPRTGIGPDISLYSPAQPLNRTTLGRFRASLRHAGNDEGDSLIGSVDPLLDWYREQVLDDCSGELDTRDLETLLRESGSERNIAT